MCIPRVAINAIALMVKRRWCCWRNPGLWPVDRPDHGSGYPVQLAGVWAMAAVLPLPQIVGPPRQALVNVIDGWIAPKKEQQHN